jgi:hypothetical protein
LPNLLFALPEQRITVFLLAYTILQKVIRQVIFLAYKQGQMKKIKRNPLMEQGVALLCLHHPLKHFLELIRGKMDNDWAAVRACKRIGRFAQ